MVRYIYLEALFGLSQYHKIYLERTRTKIELLKDQNKSLLDVLNQ